MLKRGFIKFRTGFFGKGESGTVESKVGIQEKIYFNFVVILGNWNKLRTRCVLILQFYVSISNSG